MQKLKAKIHIAKKELGLTDEEYKAALFAATGKESSKDMDYSELVVVIKHFESKGWKPKPAPSRREKGKKRFENIGDRGTHMATEKQLNMLHAIWMDSKAVRVKTEAALQKFLMRIVGVSDLRFVEKCDVGKIRRAIEALK